MRRNDRRLVAFALFALAASPLAMGGATAETRLAIPLAAALACAATVAAVGAGVRLALDRTVSVALALPFGIGVLQAIPIPCVLAGSLTGHPADIAGRVAELANGSVTCALSVDTPSTRAAIAMDAAGLLAFVVGTLASRTLGSRHVTRLLAVAAALPLAVTGVHTLFDVREVYGLVAPIHATFGLVGPLLNGNHLAALAVAAMPLGVAGLRDARTHQRALGGLVAACSVGAAVASQSRGGLVLLALTTVGCAAILRRDGRDGERSAVRWRGLAAIGGLALVLVASRADLVLEDFRSSGYKTDLASSSLALAASSPMVGHGRGAFATAYAPRAPNDLRPLYAEFAPGHHGVELGPVFGTIYVLGLLAACARGFLAKSRSRRLVALAALSLVLHDFADFALELPALHVFLSLLLGAASSEATTRATRAQTGILALAFVALPLAGITAHVDDLDRGRRGVEASLERADVRTAMLRASALVRSHPYEPVALVVAAEACHAARRPCALGYSNLARRRAPRWTAPHEIAYRDLARSGRAAQAIAELHAIARTSPAYAATTFCSAPVRAPISTMLRAVPEGDGAVVFLEGIARCVDHRPMATLFRATLEARGGDGLEAATARAMERSEGREAAVALLVGRGSLGIDATLEHARLLVDLGRFGEALAALTGLPPARQRPAADGGPQDAAEARRAETRDALEALAAAGIGDRPRVAAALRRLESSATRLAYAREVAGRCDERLGDDVRAAAHYVEAYELAPREYLLDAVTRVAGRAGLPGRLAWARERRCRDFSCPP